jgi:hypothetical protein
MNRGALAILILLTGCVAAEYHPGSHTQIASVYDANRACAYVYNNVNHAYRSAALPIGGAISGVALAAAEAASPEYAAASENFDTCMAMYGWAKN